MGQHKTPKVSIGVPVFNGGRFVGEAIKSVLNQTFADFEVIVCDNASTDRTQEICEEFALKDPRVRYFRQEINIGAKANFNRVFEYSRGEYFKWVAADDVCGPRYLELTVAALDQHPDAVLAHTSSLMINGQGEILTAEELDRGVIFDEGIPVSVQPGDTQLCLDSDAPHLRFREILLNTFWCFQIFALIRRRAMLATYPKRPYYGSDKVMLAELSLLGKFVEVPEEQFFRRAHHGNSTNMDIKDREKWSQPPKTRIMLPTQFPCLAGYTAAALRLPSSVPERARCLATIASFVARPGRYRGLLRQVVGFRARTKPSLLAPEQAHET